jgi:hypothetical protein
MATRSHGGAAFFRSGLLTHKVLGAVLKSIVNSVSASAGQNEIFIQKNIEGFDYLPPQGF